MSRKQEGLEKIVDFVVGLFGRVCDIGARVSQGERRNTPFSSFPAGKKDSVTRLACSAKVGFSQLLGLSPQEMSDLRPPAQSARTGEGSSPPPPPQVIITALENLGHDRK